eukprot:8827291-Pyramimonas_sp.AAC.1
MQKPIGGAQVVYSHAEANRRGSNRIFPCRSQSEGLEYNVPGSARVDAGQVRRFARASDA